MKRKALTPLFAGLSLLLAGCGDTDKSSVAASPHEGMEMGGLDMSAQAACGTANLALNKPATASSVEGNFTAASAVDGNPNTRWSSNFSDPQWLQVNLKSPQPICALSLQWEAAYGKAFKIEVSTDAQNWTKIYETSAGAGGTQTITPATGTSGQYIRLTGTARHTGYGYSLFEFSVFGAAGSGTAPGTGWVDAPNPVTGVTPSTDTPPKVYFHEFQAQCAVSRSNLKDDPIKSFNQPGVSHMHTFFGNTTTNAATTTASLQAGSTACSAPGDKSGYWVPTVYSGDVAVQPVGTQTIYYKTGVLDYTSVRPFPTGLRFIAGDMDASAQEFITAPGAVEGWECGDSAHNADIPATCPSRRDVQLNIRYQAPSCWDGLHLDSPDHKMHMAYPVAGRCPASHPVALPMIETKLAFPVNGDMSRVRLSSGRGSSYHFDFFNAWDERTLAAMVKGCINAGRQCNSRGWDERYPESTAVLGRDFLLH